MIDPETKSEVTKDYRSGKSVVVAARQPGTARSTAGAALKNKNKTTEAAKGSVPPKAARLNKNREKHLTTWTETQTQKRVPLSAMMIIAETESLFAILKVKGWT